jgi:Na+/H+ antiporter NhaD/arsenite permease-like protein
VPTFPDPHLGWLTLSMASRLAGNLTVTGSVANIIVIERAAAHGVQVDFHEYLRVGLPLTLVTLVLGAVWLFLVR